MLDPSRRSNASLCFSAPLSTTFSPETVATVQPIGAVGVGHALVTDSP